MNRSIVSLGEVLKRFAPEKIVDVGSACSLVSERMRNKPDDPLPGNADEQARLLGQISTILEDVGLQFSLKKLQKITDAVRSGGYKKRAELAYAMDELSTRIEDELESSIFVQLGQQEATFFKKSDVAPMGPEVDGKFPSAKYDIVEAYKCLAFGRATATVFHAMRILEHGLRATAACLGAPNPLKGTDRNWGVVLREIKRAIDLKWPTAKDRHHGDGQLFESLHASLDAVRNPWRNAAMHVEEIYTKEEAEHILACVRAFMQKLATRCDENGLPPTVENDTAKPPKPSQSPAPPRPTT